jgi:3-dehydroquinate synthase
VTFVPGDIRTNAQGGLAAGPDASIVGSAERPGPCPVEVCEDESAAVDVLLDRIDGRRVALVTDHTVARLHAWRLSDRLRAAGITVERTSFPAGEGSRSIATAISLLDWLAEAELARHDVVVAMGGGVVIETVGWVAGAYLRGVPYCNVPTTLLSQVDALHGGNMSVDHPGLTNFVGGFHRPTAVVSNVGYLASLGRREARAGLAEAIKKGITSSPALFALIERHHEAILGGDRTVTASLVRCTSLLETRLIARDPGGAASHRPLNFGHTIGQAVESATGYETVLHGEAVAFGMACAARVAAGRGLLAPDALARMTALLRRVGLPVSLDALAVVPDPGAVVSVLSQIREIRAGHLSLVLPVGLGRTLITDDVSDEEIRAALVDIQEPLPGAGAGTGGRGTRV